MTGREPIRVLELRSVWGTGGGPEKTILLGAAKSDPDRYRTTVCYLRDQRDPVFGIDARAKDLSVDYVEVRERHSFDFSIWPALRRLVRERRIDIVHAHDYKTDLLALLLARFEEVVPFATAHGWAGHGWKEAHLYYPADRRLLARFPTVAVVSTDMKEWLVRCGARRERVVVVPNGIDGVRYRRHPESVLSSRAELGLPPDAVIIGAVGRLESEKNYPLLIDAVLAAMQTVRNLRLLVAGDGSLRPRLQARLDAAGLGTTCRLLGHVSDVVRFHHALDVFVMCSDNEGSPNAVLEAMAMETPVIATAVGGIPDLVTAATGLLVPKGDLPSLATAIARLAGDPSLRQTLTRSAREMVERELSFDARMRRVERIYDDLMGRHRETREGRRG